jgi:uncharacterized coiled-coil DUF342 family protein
MNLSENLAGIIQTMREAIERADAAERERDAVGFQLVAAQAEITRLQKGLRDVEALLHDVVKGVRR